MLACMRRGWPAARTTAAATAWRPTTKARAWRPLAQFYSSVNDGALDASAQDTKPSDTEEEPKKTTRLHRSTKRWPAAKYKLTPRDLEAFKIFKEQHGHLMVPNAFEVVPEDDDTSQQWPLHLHGLPLGKVVSNARQSYKKGNLSDHDMQQLEELGFVWDVREHRWQHETLASLKCFKKAYGDFPIPYPFIVPDGDARWPAHLWGQKLGIVHCNLRTRAEKYSARRQAELEAIGFPMDRSEDTWWTRLVLPALTTFHAKHGHVNVPKAFQVPHGDRSWPERSWGLKLGFSVDSWRQNWDDLADYKRQDLEGLGFDRSPKLSHWTKSMLPALEAFQKLNGHLRIRMRPGPRRRGACTWAMPIATCGTRQEVRSLTWLSTHFESSDVMLTPKQKTVRVKIECC